MNDNKEKKPLISVIVPVYNTANYLPRCVNSILEQTYKNIEIILIDDGSTDGSGGICDQYAAENPLAVKVIHQDNAGQANARNAGLDIMRGEWFAFADSDDYIDTMMLEKLYNAAIAYGMMLVSGGYTEIQTSGNKRDNILTEITSIITYEDILYYKFIQKPSIHFLAFSTKLYHRSLINCDDMQNIRFDSGIKISEDALFMHRVLSKAGKMLYIPESIYIYCRHNESVTKSKKYEDIMTEFLALEKITHIISKVNPVFKRAGRLAYAENALNRILKIYRKNLQEERKYIPALYKHLLRYGIYFLMYGKYSLPERIRYLFFLFPKNVNSH